jgi:hypothetical protein
MNAKCRRKVEMGRRALGFSRVHPDASPGYAATIARLQDRLGRAEQLATQQHEGLATVHAATKRKSELRRKMKRAHLNHLMRVGEAVALEAPDLAEKLVLTRAASTYLAFQTVAHSMAAEALGRKELLVKYGLAETVLDSLQQALAQFDEALAQGAEGHRAHVGASAELDTVADEIVHVVKLMDGLNRYRFENDPESMAAWESASNVVATPQPAEHKPEAGAPATPPQSGGEVRPAA